MRRFLIASMALAASACLIACGGSGSSAEGDAVAKVVTATLTTNTKADCTDLETTRFLEQLALNKSASIALKSCEGIPPATNAESVEVSNISVKGDSATATAKPSGGIFDGQTLNFSLVKEKGQWRLDHLDSFTGFSLPAFTAAYAKTVAQPKLGLTQKAVDCTAKKLSKLPSSEAEGALISGNSKVFAEASAGC